MSIWKKLVGQNINIDDIKEVEIRQIKKFNDMLKSDRGAYEENASDYVWSTELSDGSTLDISPKGSGGAVSYDERLEYVQRALRVRLI